jgi:hypothetical protein
MEASYIQSDIIPSTSCIIPCSNIRLTTAVTLEYTCRTSDTSEDYQIIMAVGSFGKSNAPYTFFNYGEVASKSLIGELR